MSPRSRTRRRCPRRSPWRDWPKTETHLHLEGSVTPGQLGRLHRRHELPWAAWTAAEIRRALAFRSFSEFLASFRAVCQALRREEDFAGLTRALFARLERARVVHAEFFYTPAISLKFGLDPVRVVEQILETAAAEGRRRRISWGLVLDNVRQFPVECFTGTVDLAVRFRRQGVVGVGLGGDETASGPEPFRPGFDRARRDGLRIYLHTGETGSMETMAADVAALSPDRIGHGLRVVEHPGLRDLVRSRQAVIDVCLSSNLATGVVPTLDRHPVWKMAAQKVAFTLATDDPGLFETTLDREYGLLLSGNVDPDLPEQLVAAQLENPLLPPEGQQALRRLSRELSGDD